MKAALALLVITVVLGSPIWTSLLAAVVARRSLLGASIACCLQLLIAYSVWWFFWGGGIGGEAHLPDTWQVAFLAALAPIAVTVIIRVRTHREPNQASDATLESAPGADSSPHQRRR